jgi:SPOR domain
VLTAAGVLAALLLSGSDGSSTTTVVTRGNGSSEASAGSTAAAPLPSRSIEAGRYVQAGSFKFAADAEKERRRLAAAGIEVEVMPSEEAQDLYPGFQVLLAGPLHSGSEEGVLLKKLHGNGVPSAFTRSLTPALPAPPQSRLARGTWTGKLEESSSSNPKFDRSLPVTFVTSSDGREGTLTFLDIDCVAELQAEPSAGPILRFGRTAGCFAGSWQLRPAGGQLMLTFLPPDSDLIVLGELHLP